MTAVERKAIILQRVNSAGSISIKELAQEIRVSEMTVRRDLDCLERTNC